MPWVKTAVAEEDAKPSNPMWKGEPNEEKNQQKTPKAHALSTETRKD
jgi:hypothetical protein